MSSAIRECCRGEDTTPAVTALTRLCAQPLPLLVPMNAGSSSPKTVWAHYILLFNLFYCFFFKHKSYFNPSLTPLDFNIKISYTILLEIVKFYGIRCWLVWYLKWDLRTSEAAREYDLWLIRLAQLKEKAFSLDREATNNSSVHAQHDNLLTRVSCGNTNWNTDHFLSQELL